MKKWIYMTALLLGAGIGTLLVRTTDRICSHRTDASDSEIAMSGKTARASETAGVRIGRMISAETDAMNENLPISKALDLLFAERKSPMRTRAFLKNRIQMMTTDQLTRALMNGDIQSKAELEETARRLAKEDPEGTFNHFDAQELRLYGMENLYTFADTLLRTWGDADAVAVVERLKKMKRGGSQQDMSLRFSGYWAKTDPAAAAAHFEELIYLRNMQDQGDMVFTDNTYAEEIVKSWQQKDESAMRESIEKLTD